MKYKWHFLKMAVLAPLAIAALGWFVMALWNWLIPSLFVGAQAIDYLRAIGLLLLCRILFGGFRGYGGGHRWRHRWAQMTPEEREKFQAGMHGSRCKHGRDTERGTER